MYGKFSSKLFHWQPSLALFTKFRMRGNVANERQINKKGEANNPDGYIPIAICSGHSEILESMVNFHKSLYIGLVTLFSSLYHTGKWVQKLLM